MIYATVTGRPGPGPPAGHPAMMTAGRTVSGLGARAEALAWHDQHESDDRFQ